MGKPRNLGQCAYYAGVARRILADRYGITYDDAGDRMTDASMHAHFKLEGTEWALVSAYDSIVWCASWLTYSANLPPGKDGETRYPRYEFVLRGWGQLRGYIEKGGRDCTTTDAAIAIQNAIEDVLAPS